MNRALIVGINNYADSRNDLKGCVNDATLMSRVMSNTRGFTDVKLLLNEAATYLNISQQLETLVNTTEPGDHLLFYFSGHGTQVPDTNNDELDSLDECLVTHDHSLDNPFTDDVLKKCLNGHREDAHITVIVDACHSGTITDAKGKVYCSELDLGDIKDIPVKRFGIKQTDPETQRHLLLASSAAKQTSLEIWLNRRRQGLMTGVFLNYLRKKSHEKSTWQQLHKSFSRRVARRSRMKQNPVLTGPISVLNSRPFTSYVL